MAAKFHATFFFRGPENIWWAEKRAEEVETRGFVYASIFRVGKSCMNCCAVVVQTSRIMNLIAFMVTDSLSQFMQWERQLCLRFEIIMCGKSRKCQSFPFSRERTSAMSTFCGLKISFFFVFFSFNFSKKKNWNLINFKLCNLISARKVGKSLTFVWVLDDGGGVAA